MPIRNSPLLTCMLYTVSALGCSDSLHYPEAVKDTLDRVEGLGEMGILYQKSCYEGTFAALISLLMVW